MAWNGIGTFTNVAGMIPWPVMVLYFAVAFAALTYWGKKSGGLRRFKTRDLVYIAIGVAAAVVWQFYPGAYLSAPFNGTGGLTDFGFYGELFIIFITAGVVRKVGVGMVSMFIYGNLADLLSYGFSGEPVYYAYEVLTYGLFIDLVIAFEGDRLFGIGVTRALASVPSKLTAMVGSWLGLSGQTTEQPVTVAETIEAGRSSLSRPIIDGAVMGFLWSLPGSLFYLGFFSPFLYGAVVSWGAVWFDFITYLPIGLILGPIAGVAARRVARSVG